MDSPKLRRTEAQVSGQRNRFQGRTLPTDRRDPRGHEEARSTHGCKNKCGMAAPLRWLARLQYLTVVKRSFLVNPFGVSKWLGRAAMIWLISGTPGLSIAFRRCSWHSMSDPSSDSKACLGGFGPCGLVSDTAVPRPVALFPIGSSFGRSRKIGKPFATDRSLLLSGKRLEAGGGTFVGAVSISRTVVLTAVRISRSVNGASRSTVTAWRRESRSPLGR